MSGPFAALLVVLAFVLFPIPLQARAIAAELRDWRQQRRTDR